MVTSSHMRDIPKSSLSKFTEKLKVSDARTTTEPGIAMVVALKGWCDHLLLVFRRYRKWTQTG